MPDTTGERPCTRCGKSLRPGVTFCVACGCHNYDAEAAVDSVARGLMNAKSFRGRLARIASMFRVDFRRWR